MNIWAELGITLPLEESDDQRHDCSNKQNINESADLETEELPQHQEYPEY